MCEFTEMVYEQTACAPHPHPLQGVLYRQFSCPSTILLFIYFNNTIQFSFADLWLAEWTQCLGNNLWTFLFIFRSPCRDFHFSKCFCDMLVLVVMVPDDGAVPAAAQGLMHSCYREFMVRTFGGVFLSCAVCRWRQRVVMTNVLNTRGNVDLSGGRCPQLCVFTSWLKLLL